MNANMNKALVLNLPFRLQINIPIEIEIIIIQFLTGFRACKKSVTWYIT